MRRIEGVMAMVASMGLGLPAIAHANASLPLAALPQAARTTIADQVGKHPIANVSEQTAPNGGTYYEARFKTLTTGHTAVDVAANGALLGEYRKLEEPMGDGG